jgi:hypothetical protein
VASIFRSLAEGNASVEGFCQNSHQRFGPARERLPNQAFCMMSSAMQVALAKRERRREAETAWL